MNGESPEPAPTPHRRRPARKRGGLRLCLALIDVAASALVVTTVWPDPLFAYSFDGGAVVVHSDRPIPPDIIEVVRDVERRVGTSELPAAGPYQVYLCNDDWKLAYFGRRLSIGFGGVTDVYLTRHIFIRPADVERNAILPPASWRFSLADRPLSYFIAHEIAHVQQVAALGRLAYLKAPTWLIEGYADHVGKGGAFDVAGNLEALRLGKPELDPANGLYSRYHLAVELLLGQRGFMDLVANPPDPDAVLAKAARPGA